MPFTYAGQNAALFGAGLSYVATRLACYSSASTPAEAGTGFTEVSGGGYARITISHANWSSIAVGAHRGIQLADEVFTAVGGSIADIAGCYLLDSGGNVLAWWARTSVLTLADGEFMTVDDAKLYFTSAG